MATGRTISASFLTDLDRKVIELCEAISKTIYDSIPSSEFKNEFKKEYGISEIEVFIDCCILAGIQLGLNEAKRRKEKN